MRPYSIKTFPRACPSARLRGCEAVSRYGLCSLDRRVARSAAISASQRRSKARSKARSLDRGLD